MLKKNIKEIFSRLQQQNPNPTTELVYNNNFEFHYPEICSQNEQVSILHRE